MENTCINCGSKFENRNKGYKRTSIDSHYKLPSISLRAVIDNNLKTNVTPDKSLFVCFDCAKSVVKIHKSKTESESALNEFLKVQSECSYLGKRRRPLFSSTPFKSANDPAFLSPISKKRTQTSCVKNVGFSPKKNGGNHDSSEKPSTKTFQDKAVSALRNSHYYRCFKILYSKSRAARQGLNKFIKHAVRIELQLLNLDSLHINKKLDEESLKNFTWKPFIEVAKNSVPLLSSAVIGAITSTSAKENRIAIDTENNVGPLLPAYGLLLSTVLHLRFPTKVNFLQDVVSVEMYRSSCNHKLFKWFNKLGICRSVTTARNVVDRLCVDFDKKINVWKHNVEGVVGSTHNSTSNSLNISASESELSTDSTAIYDISVDQQSDISDESISGMSLSDDDLDDLDGIIPLLESSVLEDGNGDEARYDCISEPGYSLCWDNVQKLSIKRHKEVGKNEMLLWALSFATKNRISFFHLMNYTDTKAAADIPIEHFLPSHNDFQQMRNRMEIICERLLVKNFAFFQEKDVCYHIPHQYSKESSRKSDIVNLGVQKENPASARGVIEIMKFLKRYIPLADDGSVIPLICHGDQLSVERMITARMAMAVSEDQEDTLSGLIPRPQGFHKRCILLQDFMNRFFNARSAVSKGSLYHIKNRFQFNSIKTKVADNVNDTTDFVNFVTEGLVCLLACQMMNTKSVEEVPEKQTSLREICLRIVDTIWPDFDGSLDKCAGLLLEDTIPYQTEVDDMNKTFRYDAEDTINESDSEFEEREVNKDSSLPDTDDHKFMYTCSMTWYGLKLMVDKDCERENDGDAMMNQWRIDMIDFWQNNHNKYLILGHRLLAAINGWLPRRIVQDIIWNSTANLSGGPGNNLALDLVNEFQNNEFKTNLRNAHGQYSDKQVLRCSRMVGSLGKGIDDVFNANIMHTFVSRSRSTKAVKTNNIEKFLKVYMPEHLFTRSTRCHHPGFQGYTNTFSVSNPEKLQKRLKKYSKELDDERYITE